jgi:hypothetical protein
MAEIDDDLKAKLRSMWTPEMLDRFEADVRKLLEASPVPPEERERLVAEIKDRAMNSLGAPRVG